MAVDTLNPGIARRFRGKCRQSQDPEFSAQRRSLGVVTDLSFAPVHIKRAITLTTLVRLVAHRIVHRHGEQLATVRAVDPCGAGDGSRESKVHR